MADRFYTTYRFHGYVTQEVYDNIQSLIHELDDGGSDGDSISQVEVAWGTDEEIEKFIRDNGLVASKEIEGKWDYPPELHIFDPVTDDWDSYEVNSQWEPVVRSAGVIEKLAEGVDVAKWLDSITPPELPELLVNDRWLVVVKQICDDGDLDIEDRQDFVAVGAGMTETFKADGWFDDGEKVLDWFHESYAISCLDCYEIKAVRAASAPASV